MRVGILGGGQLGRMLALAGYPLGMHFRVFDPTPDACAGQVAEHIASPFENERALERFGHRLDVVTFEWENVPAAAAHRLARSLPFYPSPEALETAQDRLAEKTIFRSVGVDTAPFAPVQTRGDLHEAAAQIGLPAVLKTRRLGYDGKGQYVLRRPEDEDVAWQALGGVPLILEAFVPFGRELSIIGARGLNGELAFYPVVENHHRDGILRLTLAPAPDCSPKLQTEAETVARRVMEQLEYVGVLAIELFEFEGRLLANEMATRVHNSGHWTLDGAETSQFENHLRAITGLPLGSTAPLGVSAMINLLGGWPEPKSVLGVPGAHLHLYGKEPRPGRKVGHVNLRADGEAELRKGIQVLLDLVDRKAVSP
jgi:5-(carboxyamino)imidazole ribonucleotide synthase